MAARYVYVVLVWAFLAAVAVQTLLAGLGIFGDPRDIGLHVQLGYILHLSPILILAAAAVGRVGRGTLLWVGALVLITFVQPLLPSMAGSSALLAALHPVLALLIFAITARLAWAAVALIRKRPAPLPGDASQAPS